MRVKQIIQWACIAVFFWSLTVSPAAASPESSTEPTFGQITRKRAPDVITIGLIDTFSPDFYINTYSPTVDRLMQSMPQRQFRFVEINYQNAAAEIDQEKPDFIVCSASAYADLAASRGAHQIGTRVTAFSKNVAQSVGSVFIVRTDSAYRSLQDLQGTSVAVTDVASFDGWIIAQGELAKQGLDPGDHFSSIQQTHYAVPDVAALVLLGHVQAGVMSSEQYDTLQQLEPFKARRLRVIAEKNKPDEITRSTERYPDAVFASMPWARSEDVSALTVSLLSMDSRSTPFHWEVCNDFVPTMQLLKTLAIGPYAYLKDMSPEGLFRRFKVEIILFLLFSAAVLFHVVTVNVLVRRRTAELTEAVDEIKRSHREAERNRKQIAMLERAGVVSQLSTLFAHEIKQPVMNIVLYCEALRMHLKKRGLLCDKAAQLMDNLNSEVERTSGIVRQVRSYAKKQTRTICCCSLSELVKKAVSSAGNPKVVWGTLPDAFVLADPFELQFVCTNFIKNAVDAVKNVNNPRIRIEIESRPQGWALSVIDNGPAIDDEVFVRLGKITTSSKSDGLGFGLAIASSIAEINGGHLEFKRQEPTGLCASIVLKKCSPEDHSHKVETHEAKPN